MNKSDAAGGPLLRMEAVSRHFDDGEVEALRSTGGAKARFRECTDA